MINVIVADHLTIYRMGTARVLAVEDNVRIVSQPRSPEQLARAITSLFPHVAIISSGYLSVIPEIQPVADQKRIALLMLAERGEDPATYVKLGFSGVVFRSADSLTLVRAVRRLAEGEAFVQSAYAPQSSFDEDLVGGRARQRLSHTELHITAGVLRGYKNREIAKMISNTEQVVKHTMRAIFDKLGVSDRLELALYVVHHKQLAQAVAMIENSAAFRLMAPERAHISTNWSRPVMN
jgi:DNA-binding NarL/FixJ family response regulator